jgi:N-acetylglucosaminyldiphosphoundecaprenol N-acetyl-beta-D-mannosaminyltransferase
MSTSPTYPAAGTADRLVDQPRAVDEPIPRGEARVTERISILGVPLDNVTMEEAIQGIVERLDDEAPRQVCFVNADCVNVACRNTQYREVLCNASMTLADGIGLKLAGLAFGRKIRDNVNGTDLFPRLCAKLAGTGKGTFLLGARPGACERVRDWVVRCYPEMAIAGCHHGYFPPEDEAGVVGRIADSGAALLLVAFGAPRQELWIARHLDKLGVKVAMGVGGLFDFYSGRIPRAPLWIRNLGMEWLFRLRQEPGRLWKRYLLGNPRFLARVARDRIRRRSRMSDEG